MPAFLLPLLPVLSSLLPYVVGLLAVVGLYFGVKRKGVLQERARQEEAVLEAKRVTEDRLAHTQADDVQIEAKVRKQIEDIKKIEKADAPKPEDTYRPGDIFRF